MNNLWERPETIIREAAHEFIKFTVEISSEGHLFISVMMIEYDFISELSILIVDIMIKIS